MSITIKIVFWAVAFSFSLFYGLKATKIFGVSTESMPSSGILHQAWFNFLGSMLGWILAWTFVPDIYDSIKYDSHFEIGLGRILIFILAFIGITGHMPYAIMLVINNLKLSFEKLSSLINKS